MPYRKASGWGRIKPHEGARLDGGDPINQGLVGRFLFNERHQAARFKDIARGNWMYNNTGASLVPGAFGGYAQSYDGVTGAGRVNAVGGAGGKPLISAYPFTIVAWGKTTGAIVLASMSDEATDNAYVSLVLVSTSARAYAGDAGGSNYADSGAVTTSGVWHQIVGVWNSTTDRQIFIDGRYTGINNTSRTPSLATWDNTMFGVLQRTGAVNFGAGMVDNVSLYNRALSATEILRLYNEPFAGVVAPRRRIISSPPASPGAGRMFFTFS